MVTVTLAVSDEIRRKMKQFDEVNWSALVRKIIEEKIKQLTWKQEMLKRVEDEKDFTRWTVEMGGKVNEGIAKRLKKEGLLGK